MRTNRYIFLSILTVAVCSLFSACRPSHEQEVDKLNDTAYSYRYRSLDSTEHYARKALQQAADYESGRAEAYNHLAFVSTGKMHYAKAYLQLDSVNMATDNQIELAVADVQRMRISQRQSKNKSFYNHRESAHRRMRRINEEPDMLSERQKLRMVYAQSEFEIVTSTYYYYIGLEQQSAKAIANIDPNGVIQRDTAQYLNYLYNMGAGGIITQGTQAEINQREFDYLLLCYQMAVLYDFPYWKANSMQALSEHLQEKRDRDILMHDNLPAMKYLNVDNVDDSLLAGNLAQRALNIFRQYGDVYQTAGAYRTLAQCFWLINDNASALDCLNNALNDNKAIHQAPDLVASIREELSVVYSSMNDKPRSDYNRNIYLDLQEQTRQDRYLESRAEQLDKSSLQLNLMIGAVVLAIVILVVLLFVFNYLRQKKDKNNSLDQLLQPLEEWKHENEQRMNGLNDLYEEINEVKNLSKLHYLKNKKRNVEQRAKVSLVNSITPFIDRIVNELDCLAEREGESKQRKNERYGYVAELTDKINALNNFLTEWIQLQQGQLNLHIESFPLQPLFDMVAKGRMGFQLKGIELEVEPSKDVVKADRILTLFMINTLADNARKYTERGGKVRIYSRVTDESVEISIEDNGTGMNEEELSKVFQLKVEGRGSTQKKEKRDIVAEDVDVKEKGHGFGLLNCRGIIEKYRKISSLFHVCTISAESEKGRGSRFYFRLPKGIVRNMVVLLAVLMNGNLSLAAETSHKTKARYSYQTRATYYADKAYSSNIRNDFQQALCYADSARMVLNETYRKLRPNGVDTMVAIGSLSAIQPEIKWFHDNLKLDYEVILDIRNESAVAALALHKWDVYRYNNKVYTQLYKELSADNSLGSYVRIMQRSESNKNVAVVLLMLLLLSIFPAYYILYYRHKVYFRFCIEKVGRINDLLLSSVSDEEKLKEIRSVAINRFPSSLQHIVEQIVKTLQHSVETNQVQQEHIDLAKDELKRSQYENEKLYISNSVLDNCLSTLKHETMYYPSRIRQLLDRQDRNLNQIREVAIYYKELYSLLSKQAILQLKNVKFECIPVPVASVLENIGEINMSSTDILLLGDRQILKMLFEFLHDRNEGQQLQVDIHEKNGKYVECRVHMARLHLSDEECLNLFVPQSMEKLPYFLCRQIVRDTGEYANARGCGIVAENDVNGKTYIIITLAKYKEHITDNNIKI